MISVSTAPRSAQPQTLEIPVSFDQSLVTGQPFPKGGRREVGPTKRRNEGLPSMLQITPLASKALPLILVSLHLGLHVANTLSRRLLRVVARSVSASEQVGQTVGFLIAPRTQTWRPAVADCRLSSSLTGNRHRDGCGASQSTCDRARLCDTTTSACVTTSPVAASTLSSRRRSSRSRVSVTSFSATRRSSCARAANSFSNAPATSANGTVSTTSSASGPVHNDAASRCSPSLLVGDILVELPPARFEISHVRNARQRRLQLVYPCGLR